MSVSRTSRLSVRASPPELMHWNHIARSHGHVSTSDWIRSLLASAEFSGDDGSFVPDELRSIRNQLSRIGNNLNQLARSAHCGDTVQCGVVLTDAEALIQRLDIILSRSRKKISSRTTRCKCVDATMTHH